MAIRRTSDGLRYMTSRYTIKERRAFRDRLAKGRERAIGKKSYRVMGVTIAEWEDYANSIECRMASTKQHSTDDKPIHTVYLYE